MKQPTKQSRASRELNEMRRTLPLPEQYVWAVYNSGDPIWSDSPYSIELLLFSTKATALQFVRATLKEHWQINSDNLSDEEVEDLMWSNDDDGQGERYLHLYELRVHEDDYLTLSIPY